MRRMAKIYFDQDADLAALQEISIGIIGYGNQGRAHALNLRDSGLRVFAGTREGSKSREQARTDGFSDYTIEEVATNCEVIALLLPDEVIPQIYESSIEPYLEPHDTFVFAHGFTVRHKTIRVPDNADVILVAPTGPGRQLRTLYQDGRGLPGLVAVEQDSSGNAWNKCLAYARGIGCTRAGAILTTFEEETVTDLYCEQSVLCGGIPQLIKTSFDTLVARGYQPELAYISCLKEVKLIADLLFERGMYGMRKAISNTAKYGSAIAGPELVNSSTAAKLEQLLDSIESGEFGKQFLQESKQGYPVTNALLTEEKHSRMARVAKELQENLDF